MHEIIYVETKSQLKALNDCSAMTWEGLHKDDWQEAAKLAGTDDCKIFVTTGKTMNEICHLTGDNAYPDDLSIVSLDKYKGLAMRYGARWMDDIIYNNARREGYRPF